MKKNFLGKRLLFITAHPDDESYASAGTIFANYKAGGESLVISATLGERGKAHLLKPLSDNQLKKKRRAELAAACRFLKVKQLFILNLPDGGLTNKKPQAHKKIMTIVKKVEPNYIVSFGQDGMSGHLDHIAISEVSRGIAKAMHIPFLAYAMSPARRKLLKRSPHLFKSRRRFGKYVENINHAKPNIKIKINRRVKIKAVGFHKSQLGGRKPFSHFPPEVRNEWLKYEYFRQDLFS